MGWKFNKTYGILFELSGIFVVNSQNNGIQFMFFRKIFKKRWQFVFQLVFNKFLSLVDWNKFTKIAIYIFLIFLIQVHHIIKRCLIRLTV